MVISGKEYNSKSDDVVVAAITSNTAYQSEYTILIDSANLSYGIIPKQSIIRCDKIYTISRDIIIKNSETFNDLRLKIDKLLSE